VGGTEGILKKATAGTELQAPCLHRFIKLAWDERGATHGVMGPGFHEGLHAVMRLTSWCVASPAQIYGMGQAGSPKGMGNVLNLTEIRDAYIFVGPYEDNKQVRSQEERAVDSLVGDALWP
jgi:hypothetical protein